jgi:hypothetical protein
MPIDAEGDGWVPGHGVESVSFGVTRAASAVTRLATSSRIMHMRSMSSTTLPYPEILLQLRLAVRGIEATFVSFEEVVVRRSYAVIREGGQQACECGQ